MKKNYFTLNESYEPSTYLEYKKLRVISTFLFLVV